MDAYCIVCIVVLSLLASAFAVWGGFEAKNASKCQTGDTTCNKKGYGMAAGFAFTGTLLMCLFASSAFAIMKSQEN